MKKLLGIVVLGLLLVGCETGTSVYKGPLYYVTVKHEDTKETFSAGASSRGLAIHKATTNCQNKYPTTKTKCFVDSTTTVENKPKPPYFSKTGAYWKGRSSAESREDKMIAKARSICEKIGVTPGTDKFIDCTIKMMSTSSGQQTVIVGQRKRTSIYPLHCRQMGGASAC